ncbi:hypothetical protein N665_5680s0001 [Sinapis alba]|nr:hypothetical protein N665_5680s0001 [Sinapis alba]
MAFNPEKSQSQEYVRAHVSFNVANPLHKSRTVNLPKGGQADILYFYERVHKRCYHCQRLTHERDVFPLLIRSRQKEALERRKGAPVIKPAKELLLKTDGPLYGVLQESQVRIYPVLGRPKIAPEVLEGNAAVSEAGRGRRKKDQKDRVRKSVKEV